MPRSLLDLPAVLACLALAACGSTPCDDSCADLATSCGEEADAPVCDDLCGSAESACETCFSCLADEDLCEIEPGNACSSTCEGCKVE